MSENNIAIQDHSNRINENHQNLNEGSNVPMINSTSTTNPSLLNDNPQILIDTNKFNNDCNVSFSNPGKITIYIK